MAETKKETEKTEIEKRVDEAQHVIEVAATGDYFSTFAEKDNVKGTHEELRDAALGLLGDNYPGVDVMIVTYPNSEFVDVKCVAKAM